MPKIKVDHIVSFSSEDPVHLASNVLSSEADKKWKCKDAGEKSATITLQLEKPCIISGLDIGNENSAYIEVLASRSNTHDEFKVLLVMSSFMTPLEARQSTNTNKVRMFTKDMLSKPECDQKWDQVKVVCTQPFNKHVQYGLSFIVLHSHESNVPLTNSPGAVGKFSLIAEPAQGITTGSIFARRQVEQDPPKGAAAIRDASSTPSTSSNSNKFKPEKKITIVPKIKDSNGAKNEVVTTNRRDLCLADTRNNRDTPQKTAERDDTTKDDLKCQESATKNGSTAKETSKRKSKDYKSKERHTKKAKTEEKTTKVFNQLLSGVVLVISGIQNPDRASLRTMATSMGAKYKSDWDPSCTHLICAFPNTPKFNQVKGKGKIIKRAWIEDCYSQRKRLPWRRYALDRDDKNAAESEEEICESKPVQIEPSGSSEEEGGSDVEGYDDSKVQEVVARTSNSQGTSAFSVDTDDEELNTKMTKTSKALPSFFQDSTFYVDDKLNPDIILLIKRYVLAYKGNIETSPSVDVDYVITTEGNVSNQLGSRKGLLLKPDWIWECHNAKDIVPTASFVIN